MNTPQEAPGNAVENTAPAPARAAETARPPVDARRPGRARKFRRLLAEIAMIVIGVGITLAGAQAIAWLHLQKDMAQTREAIRKELGDNMAAFQLDIPSWQCGIRHLEALQGWLDRSQPGDVLPLARHAIDSPPTTALLSALWEVEKAGAVVSRMPMAERAKYAEIYTVIVILHATMYGKEWRDLSEFDVLRPLTLDDRIRLHKIVFDASKTTTALALNGQLVLDEMKALGIDPDTHQESDGPAVRKWLERRNAFCAPLLKADAPADARPQASLE